MQLFVVLVSIAEGCHFQIRSALSLKKNVLKFTDTLFSGRSGNVTITRLVLLSLLRIVNAYSRN